MHRKSCKCAVFIRKDKKKENDEKILAHFFDERYVC